MDPQAYRPCVGIMVLKPQPDARVWIGKRSKAAKLAINAGGSWWQMPQGGIDKGEAPEAAALRELREETNMTSVEILAETSDWHYYDLPPELLGKAWGGKYCGQRQKWFAVRFLGDDSEINITPDDPDEVEFDAWRWADQSEILDVIIPFKRDVYKAVLAEFAAPGGPLA